MKDLQQKIINLVRNVQPEATFESVESSDKNQITLLFDCWRDDGILFQAREDEEDDDHPDFVGAGKLQKSLQTLGDQYSVDTWCHEKGLFSVKVSKTVSK